MLRIKEISNFVYDINNPHWRLTIPIGADDKNIDITSETTQPDGSTITDIQNDSNIALDTDAVIVQNFDTEAFAWTKFNRFRKRVINNINNLLSLNNVKDEYQNIGVSNEVYSTNLINNYMDNVIGYSGTTTPMDGTINAQLINLQSKINSSTNIAIGQISLKNLFGVSSQYESMNPWGNIGFQTGLDQRFTGTVSFPSNINFTQIPIIITTCLGKSTYIIGSGGFIYGNYFVQVNSPIITKITTSYFEFIVYVHTVQRQISGNTDRGLGDTSICWMAYEPPINN